MDSIPHLIGGRPHPHDGSRFGDVFDPNTGRAQRRVPLDGAAAVSTARKVSA